jgi:hypothetical protein
MKVLIKRLIRAAKRKRKLQGLESWADIMHRYKSLTDGEFIDELMVKYHPPRRKNTI